MLDDMDQDGISLMDNSISSYHRRCFEDFLQVLSSLKPPHHLFQQDISFTDVSNEFDRYKLWCSNVGAAHDGPNYRLSLDYRLREAPSHKKQISDILNRLAETLERTSSLLEGKSQPFESQRLLDAVESSSDDDDYSPGEEDGSPEPDLDDPQDEDDDFKRRLASIRGAIAETDLEAISSASQPPVNSKPLNKSLGLVHEVPQLLETLRFTVTCLYRIPVRRPATFDRTKKLAAIDLAYFEPFDNAYIDDRCPAANKTLKERLQRTISRRRRLLFYRARHYEHIRLDLPRALPKAKKELEPLNLLPDFKQRETARPTASEKQSSKPSQFSKATTFNPADFPTFSSNILSPDDVSVVESIPSTNPSLWTGNQKLYVPPRPKGLAGGKDFLCPYCFVICQVKSDEAWKRHVLKDLEPYICTFISCAMEDHQFEDRDDWYEHELQNHRIEWCCNLDGHNPCTSPAEFLLHLQEHHPILGSSALSEDIIRQFQRPAQKGLKICPLCSKPSEKLKSHLARHMEQIALYVLGGNNQEDSELDSDASDRARRVDSSADLGSEDWSVDLEHRHFSEIPAADLPEDDILDEQSAVPDSTEASWIIPFNFIGTLSLTATLIIFLNLSSRLVSAQVVQTLHLPKYWTGEVATKDYSGDIPAELLEKLRQELTKQNTLGCLTRIENELRAVCDQALDLCGDLAKHGARDHTISKEAMVLEDFRSNIPRRQLPGLMTRIRGLKQRLGSNILLPLYNIIYVENHIPEETINSLISHEDPWPTRLFDQLDSKDYYTLLVDFLDDVNLKTKAEFSDDESEEGSSILHRSIPVEKIKTDDTANIVAEDGSPQARAMQDAIINSLAFPEMNNRQEEIVEAYPKTFEWLFQSNSLESGIALAEWLRSGNGIFWISGKAGSGKSTLMKFLCENPKTMEILHKWAPNGTITMAWFSLWNSGTVNQKSMNGLLRAILCALLRQAPDKVKSVFPQYWDPAAQAGSDLDQVNPGSSSKNELPGTNYSLRVEWTSRELRDSLIRLLSQLDHVCLFIDGLNEFDGDPETMVELLKSFLTERVKICLSSRPWIDFQMAFESVPRLRLEDETYNDIKLYVEHKLALHSVWSHLVIHEPSAALSLIHQIVENAAGVFLWVFLVVRSLLTGLSHRDSVEHLQKRVRLLPRELDSLFSHIISSIGPVYQIWASRAIQIRQKASHFEGGLCAASLSLLEFQEDDETSLVSRTQFSCLSLEDTTLAVERIELLLQTRCGGLLELAPVGIHYASIPLAKHGNCKVQYLHRTVADFLQIPEISERLVRHSGKDFSPDRTLLACNIIRLRRCFHTPVQATEFTLWADLVLQAMELAYAIEQATGSSESRLVDELERNISHQAGKPPDEDCENFLEFATVHGLAQYLKQKLKRTPHDASNPKVPPSYLKIALCRPWERRSPHRATVEALLGLGADPNANLGERTVWQKYLDFVAAQLPEADSGHLVVITTLIQYGADPMGRAVSDMVKIKFPNSSEKNTLLEFLNKTTRNTSNSESSSSNLLSRGVKWTRRTLGTRKDQG